MARIGISTDGHGYFKVSSRRCLDRRSWLTRNRRPPHCGMQLSRYKAAGFHLCHSYFQKKCCLLKTYGHTFLHFKFWVTQKGDKFENTTRHTFSLVKINVFKFIAFLIGYHILPQNFEECKWFYNFFYNFYRYFFIALAHKYNKRKNCANSH